MPAGVAAGHPATAEVGVQVLAAGGSAADAAVAAVLASCVGETILTGLAGGGFATYYDSATGQVTCLDFFVAVPGLGANREPAPMVPIEVAFGGVPMEYEIGAATAGVPGVAAGCGEVHRRWGRLPWHEVVAPAIGLARSGVPIPAPQAHTLIAVAPAMLPGDGAAVYAPDGRLLAAGDLLYHPGLDKALTSLAEEGPEVFYTGRLGAVTAETVQAAGGVMTEADLAAYRVLDLSVGTAAFAGMTVRGRYDLNATIPTLAALPDLRGMAAGARAVAIADGLRDNGPTRLGDTTNIAVVDPDGDACVVTTTLGLGSGVWLPGLGVHLNSMLGEGELITGPLTPGARMPSMMCPLVATDEAGLALAAGSAGASRIRTALVHTLVGTLVDGVPVPTAIHRPRFHVARDTVHAEPGVPEAELAALHEAGYRVHRWDGLNHYFGGASAVGRRGAGGDPRRGGLGMLL